MTSSLNRLKRRALARPGVRQAYQAAGDEFSFLDEILRARAGSGMTQAQVAERTGTTQSAIARLESPHGRHSPSIATLQRYARALGYRLEIRLVRAGQSAKRPSTEK